ncbi:MAG TPA: DUF6065 family protein [Gammaproteobacteria bacterium]|nr:DUF6065 family protein [Gammaproteobacteria bacterium]
MIKFYRILPDSSFPQRADKSAGGTLPVRAYRYCEAVRTASAFGWYVFPPADFNLAWDGVETIWKFGYEDEWTVLDSVQYPDYMRAFNRLCPSDLADAVPPMLSAGAEPGMVQIWSGLFCKTEPGWSVLVRAPANLPRSNNYEHFEGIIETDKWFGPLFVNVRLTKTDIPITFDMGYPLMQVQPLQQSTYSEAVLDSIDFADGVEDFTPHDWENYRQTITKPGLGFEREKGFYAKMVRRQKSSA